MAIGWSELLDTVLRKQPGNKIAMCLGTMEALESVLKSFKIHPGISYGYHTHYEDQDALYRIEIYASTFGPMNIRSDMIVLCLDWSEPWNFINQLQAIESVECPVHVCCYSEPMVQLENELTPGQFDFIQQALRVYCLKHGYSLQYAMDNSWIKILENVLYNQNNELKPCVLDKFHVNVPMGWDSMEKIQLISKSTDLDTIIQDYSLVIKPKKALEIIEKTVQAREEQSFYEELYGTQTNPKESNVLKSLKTSQVELSQKLAKFKDNAATSSSLNSLDKPETKLKAPSDFKNKAEIASFFQSLLEKKPAKN